MVTGKITQNGYALIIKSAEGLSPRIVEAAATGLRAGLLEAVKIAQTQYLQGPRPLRLGEVTTRLRQSIASQVTVEGQTVRGQIGSNVKYAAFHEFGYRGVEQVRAFTRVTARYTGIGAVIGGRDLKGKFLASGGKKEAANQTAGAVGFEYVKAHTRKLNYAGRPFVSPALKQAFPVILARIKSELGKIAANG